MATVWKHPNTPFWTAVFRDEDGVWRRKTTRLRDRTKALAVADEWERAGRLDRDNVLTEATNREVSGGVLERTTGDIMRKESTREFCTRWLKAKSESEREGDGWSSDQGRRMRKNIAFPGAKSLSEVLSSGIGMGTHAGGRNLTLPSSIQALPANGQEIST